jgi:hypothetical protein
VPPSLYSPHLISPQSNSYVQELEARLLHMETLFQQIAPVLDQIGQSPGVDLGGPSTASGAIGEASSFSTAAELVQSIASGKRESGGSGLNGGQAGATSSTAIKVEDDVSEQFGQLALDEHGGMRWIGGSSTMSLIQSFRALTTSPLHRVSPMEEDPRAPGPSVNKLYFPASVFFGKIHALPSAEEVEYPDRDLADKLVSALQLTCRHNFCLTWSLGGCLLYTLPFLIARYRQTIVFAAI